MSKPLISVVMPVYGVEEYLEDCIKSVLKQTIQDFEIIMVDDCSPDKSPEVCDRFAAQDSRIQVIHLEQNGGVSNARNIGLTHACGDFTFFLDPDDLIVPDLFEQVYLSYKTNPADVIIYGMIEQYYTADGDLKNEVEITYGKELFLTSAADLRKEVIHLEKKTFLGYPWNKFFRTEYLVENAVTYQKITLIEDILFNIDAFKNLESLNILNTAPYLYKKRINTSLTRQFVPEYYELHKLRIQSLYDLHENWDLLNEEVLNIIANLYVRYIFSAIQRNCDSRANMNHSMRKAFLQEIYEDELFQDLIPYANSDSFSLRVMCNQLKKRRISNALSLGRLIYFVTDKLPILFSKLKQKK